MRPDGLQQGASPQEGAQAGPAGSGAGARRVVVLLLLRGRGRARAAAAALLLLSHPHPPGAAARAAVSGHRPEGGQGEGDGPPLAYGEEGGGSRQVPGARGGVEGLGHALPAAGAGAGADAGVVDLRPGEGGDGDADGLGGPDPAIEVGRRGVKVGPEADRETSGPEEGGRLLLRRGSGVGPQQQVQEGGVVRLERRRGRGRGRGGHPCRRMRASPSAEKGLELWPPREGNRRWIGLVGPGPKGGLSGRDRTWTRVEDLLKC